MDTLEDEKLQSPKGEDASTDHSPLRECPTGHWLQSPEGEDASTDFAVHGSLDRVNSSVLRPFFMVFLPARGHQFRKSLISLIFG